VPPFSSLISSKAFSSSTLGNDYIENDFGPPTTEEIRNAHPLAEVLPQDVIDSCHASSDNSLRRG
jgi:hypothetical protein